MKSYPGIIILALCCLFVLVFNSSAPAAESGPVIECRIAEPTKDKPQSKVWFADGSWWAWLPSGEGGSHVWRRGGNGAWQVESYLDGVLNDLPGQADVYASGDTLVAALIDGSSRLAVVGLLYNPDSSRYLLIAPPQQMTETGRIETITVDRDRVGFYWIAYPSDSLDARRIVTRIIPTPVNRLGPPVVLANDVSQDDICVVERMNGAIGVLWSNQKTETVLYSRHQAGTPVGRWWAPDTVARGNKTADDHLNFCRPRSLNRDKGLRLFAATKTSLDTEGKPLLAARIYNEDHIWYNVDFAELTADGEPSRPVALWLGDHPAAAYTVYGKQSSNRIEIQHFAPDGLSTAGKPVTLLGPLPELNNVTGPKHEPAGEKVLLLASDRDGRVWEMFVTPGKEPEGGSRGPGGGRGGGGGKKGKNK